MVFRKFVHYQIYYIRAEMGRKIGAVADKRQEVRSQKLARVQQKMDFRKRKTRKARQIVAYAGLCGQPIGLPVLRVLPEASFQECTVLSADDPSLPGCFADTQAEAVLHPVSRGEKEADPG